MALVWGLDDFARETGLEKSFARDCVLNNTRFVDELDITKGGFVVYADGKGKQWYIEPERMEKFIKEHWIEIFRMKVNR
ncbi:DUF771 domain-containing protein [Listeria monocytogenes]|nr:DUF771 domain-containing protein [Listeria monocytogenes]EDN7503404.1 DUF771 domain-containing protein [Listeria monocytogenes]EDN7559084.1 DUF771 domain-containing protein [Listeria monocytogenes]